MTIEAPETGVERLLREVAALRRVAMAALRLSHEVNEGSGETKWATWRELRDALNAAGPEWEI